MPEVIDVLTLEGMVINGLVKESTLLDCEKKGKIRMSKLVIKSVNGEEYETPCYEYPRISRVYVLVSKYRELQQATDLLPALKCEGSGEV
ncbi:MAG: hypothetical protein QXZ48_06805 [Zestosphaera sp.]